MISCSGDHGSDIDVILHALMDMALQLMMDFYMSSIYSNMYLFLSFFACFCLLVRLFTCAN